MENATVDIGTRLRELREKKGLSIGEVAQNIKVPARTLSLIEDGQFDALPHPVYARSFVKSYARALGMDPEKVDAELDSLFDIQQEIEPSSVYTPVEEPSSSLKGFVRTVVFVCIVAGAAWLIYDNVFKGKELGALTEDLVSRGKALFSDEKKNNSEGSSVEFSYAPAGETSQENDSVPNEITEKLKKAEEHDASLDQAPPLPDMGSIPEASAPADFAVAPQRNAPMGSDPLEANRPITSQPSLPPSLPIAASQVEQSPAPAPAEPEENEPLLESLPPRSDAGHEVVVSANTADCWIRATGPGMEKKDILLRKGQSVTLPYDQELTLRLGNIFGVTIMHDGQEVPYSKEGAPVRTLNFPL